MVYLPTEDGSNHLILDALTDLLTLKCQTEVSANDLSRVNEVKVGPMQATPEGVMLLIHENDPFSPESWSNRPMRYRNVQASGALSNQPYEDTTSERTTAGRILMGGGSQYSRAYVLQVVVFGPYMPSGIDITRPVVRRVASTVSARATKALLEAGPKIGTGLQIIDDFGGYVIQGPFLDTSWTSPEESESLIVNVYLRFWYHMALDWSTDEW